MKKLILILFLITTPVFAQEQFIPYTINQEDHAKLMEYLGEQPAKISIPLINALNRLKQKATEEAAKKKEENK